jgi:Arc/MetJ family transcription regulator
MSRNMRTTIRLDDQLLAEAKRYASESGRTLTGLIEDALREVLARRLQPRPRERVKLTTYGRGGTQPGVDLDNSAALLDLMESDA